MVLSRLTIQNGRASRGAGIFNSGDLIIGNCVIKNNIATGGWFQYSRGGAIYNDLGGVLRIQDSEISSNTVGCGAAVYNCHAYVYLNGGDISDNDARTSDGGAIYSIYLFTSEVKGNRSVAHDNKNKDLVESWGPW